MPGPFDMAGGPFLALYAILLGAAIIASELAPRWLRPPGKTRAGADPADPAAFAVLAGGATRFADMVVSRLLAAGALRIVGRGFAIEPRVTAQNAAERAVLELPPPLDWRQIETRLRPHAAAIEARLAGAGLRLDADAVRRLRIVQTLPYLLLLGFGAIKLAVGTLRDRPVGFLALLLLLTAALALARWLRVDRRTDAGRAALATARATRERLARGPVDGEVGEAVALFGTAVLAGSALEAFHQLRTPRADGGVDSGGDAGGDGGGDGGGGCGGCS